MEVIRTAIAATLVSVALSAAVAAPPQLPTSRRSVEAVRRVTPLELKPAYDAFEQHRRPPKITVRSGKYVVAAK
jgi:murein L,D-transpeptidase YafK